MMPLGHDTASKEEKEPEVVDPIIQRLYALLVQPAESDLLVVPLLPEPARSVSGIGQSDSSEPRSQLAALEPPLCRFHPRLALESVGSQLNGALRQVRQVVTRLRKARLGPACVGLSC